LKNKNLSQKIVASTLGNRPECLDLMYRCWKEGKTFLPISPQWSVPRVEQICEELGVERWVKVSELDRDQDRNQNQKYSASEWRELFSQKEQFALLILTSGSTGKPKAVLHNLGGIYQSAMNAILHYQLNQHDVSLATLPFNHIGGIMVPLRMHLCGGQTKFSSHELLTEQILAEKPTVISLVSTQLQSALQSTAVLKHLQGMKAIILGGGPVSKNLYAQIRDRQLPVSFSYGMTETCAQFTATEVRQWRGENFVGRPFAGNTFLASALPVLELSGPTIAPWIFSEGKWHETKGKLVTQDQGQWRPEGLFLEGRQDAVFISGGENISPREIETELAKHPQVQWVKILPYPNQKFHTVGHAFFQLKSEGESGGEIESEIKSDDLLAKKVVEELRELATQAFPPYMRPKAWFALPAATTPLQGIKWTPEELFLYEALAKLNQSVTQAFELSYFSRYPVSFHPSSRQEAPALVLFHGFLGNKETWRKILPEFQNQYSCLAIDLPGHGDALYRDFPRLKQLQTFEQLAQFLRVLLLVHLRLGALKDLTLWGYSMGGRVAAHYAFSYPESLNRLILESAHLGLPEAEKVVRYQSDRALLKEIESPAALADFLKRWHQQPLFALEAPGKADFAQALVQEKLANDPRELRQALELMSIGNMPSLWEKLARAISPELFAITVLCGELDQKYVQVGKEIREARSKEVELFVVPGVGHAVHAELSYRLKSKKGLPWPLDKLLIQKD
jgi:2-succinyl-6-hydroxy-2,4-cyclohexadiene-1-carboxylate synthase